MVITFTVENIVLTSFLFYFFFQECLDIFSLWLIVVKPGNISYDYPAQEGVIYLVQH